MLLNEIIDKKEQIIKDIVDFVVENHLLRSLKDYQYYKTIKELRFAEYLKNNLNEIKEILQTFDYNRIQSIITSHIEEKQYNIKLNSKMRILTLFISPIFFGALIINDKELIKLLSEKFFNKKFIDKTIAEKYSNPLAMIGDTFESFFSEKRRKFMTDYALDEYRVIDESYLRYVVSRLAGYKLSTDEKTISMYIKRLFEFFEKQKLTLATDFTPDQKHLLFQLPMFYFGLKAIGKENLIRGINKDLPYRLLAFYFIYTSHQENNVIENLVKDIIKRVDIGDLSNKTKITELVRSYLNENKDLLIKEIKFMFQYEYTGFCSTETCKNNVKSKVVKLINIDKIIEHTVEFISEIVSTAVNHLEDYL